MCSEGPTGPLINVTANAEPGPTRIPPDAPRVRGLQWEADLQGHGAGPWEAPRQ